MIILTPGKKLAESWLQEIFFVERQLKIGQQKLMFNVLKIITKKFKQYKKNTIILQQRIKFKVYKNNL